MCQEYFGVSPGIALHCFLIPGLLCGGWGGGGGVCELRLLR